MINLLELAIDWYIAVIFIAFGVAVIIDFVRFYEIVKIPFPIRYIKDRVRLLVKTSWPIMVLAGMFYTEIFDDLKSIRSMDKYMMIPAVMLVPIYKFIAIWCFSGIISRLFYDAFCKYEKKDEVFCTLTWAIMDGMINALPFKWLQVFMGNSGPDSGHTVHLPSHHDVSDVSVSDNKQPETVSKNTGLSDSKKKGKLKTSTIEAGS